MRGQTGGIKHAPDRARHTGSGAADVEFEPVGRDEGDVGSEGIGAVGETEGGHDRECKLLFPLLMWASFLYYQRAERRTTLVGWVS